MKFRSVIYRATLTLKHFIQCNVTDIQVISFQIPAPD